MRKHVYGQKNFSKALHCSSYFFGTRSKNLLYSKNSKEKEMIPSIFNDVIGPVMRGPSSSHCAAAVRIGRIARDLMDGQISEILIEFDPAGSLATTHESQGSDMGLFGGILGWEVTDERLPESVQAIRAADIKTEIRINPIAATHPNTYKLTLKNKDKSHEIRAISSGGGMIEINQIDDMPIALYGDYYETLIFTKSPTGEIMQFIRQNLEADELNTFNNGNTYLLEIKSQRFPDELLLKKIHERNDIQSVNKIAPVLPVLSQLELKVPFITCEEMIRYNQKENLALWELAIRYESTRGNMTHEQVQNKMAEIIDILDKSIQQGITGTQYEDRILGYQSGRFNQHLDQGRLLNAGMLNRMILYVTALMEVKSAMGVIVAAPTAGSCGGLPGACFGAADELNLSREAKTKAMLAAGMIGIFIAERATFAAEVGGCQAETGAGAGMAAAALVTLADGTLEQAVSAASVALQNSLGMICDPVANRVEVPCLGKNVLAAANALTCANMALAGYDHIIPLDEVIETMDQVGNNLPKELCCTALGGLSVTPTSKKIAQQLQARKEDLINIKGLKDQRIQGLKD
jgi:L-serine dehydratase